jgi:hypothetical protein
VASDKAEKKATKKVEMGLFIDCLRSRRNMGDLHAACKSVWAAQKQGSLDVIAKPTFFVCKAQLERHIFFVLVHRNFSVISGLKPLTPADDIFACKKFFTSPALFLSGSAGLGKKVTRPLSPTSRSNDFFFLGSAMVHPLLATC